MAGSVATTWYNYVLASAGTIYNENTTSSNPANNRTPATESVCPKGWTLPSITQIRTIGPNSPGSSTYVSIFSPILGGDYSNSILYHEDTRGFWWGSTPDNGAKRHRLGYNGSGLFSANEYNRVANYIRCINKQKTVLDLTYMQEMTPEIAGPLPQPLDYFLGLVDYRKASI